MFHCEVHLDVETQDTILSFCRVTQLPFPPFPGLTIHFGDDWTNSVAVNDVCWSEPRQVIRLECDMVGGRHVHTEGARALYLQRGWGEELEDVL